MRRVGLLAALGLVVALVSPIGAAASAVTVVYPTGDIEQDSAILQAAIDAASPGDEIVLAATNQDGFATVWALGQPDVTFDTTIRPHAGAAGFPLSQLVATFFAEMAGLRQVVIDKAVTIRGETDGVGAPLTVITNPSWSGLAYSSTAALLVSSFERPVIEDLRFEHVDQAIVSFGPMVVNNVVFDDYANAIFWAVDPRAVYPSFEFGSPDYSEPVSSSLTNSVFVNGQNYYDAFGVSEVEVSGNSFLAFNAAAPVPFVGLFQVTEERVFEFLSGVPLSELAPGLQRNVVVTENRFVGTPAAGQSNAVGGLVEFGAEVFGGTMEGVTVADNIFDDWALDGIPGFSGLALIIEGDELFGPARVTDVTVTRNTFRSLSCGGCTVFGPGVAVGALSFDENLGGHNLISRLEVTKNRFENLTNADGVGFLGGVTESSVVDNDFTQSGLPGFASGGTAVALLSADVLFGVPGLGTPSLNFVFQPPPTLPPGTGLPDQILNVGAFDNVVVGLPNGGDGPAGERMQAIAHARRSLGEILGKPLSLP